MRVRKHSGLGLGLVLVLLAVFVLFPALGNCREDQALQLVIFHTNDVHGHVSQETDRNGAFTAIGYDRVHAIVKSEKTPHLLIDAGDAISGVIFANARSGDLVAQLLPKFSYDAIAVGNHEFDYGTARLLELRDAYSLPFLAANVTTSDNSHLFPSYTVKEAGGLRVGIFGLTTPMTTTATNPRGIIGLKFGTPEEVFATAREAVKTLRDERADLVIALTHLGSEAYCEPSSIQLAKNVAGIDLIVDGHSHSVLNGGAGVKEGDSLIVSTGAYMSNLGRVEVTKRPSGGYALSASLISAPETQSVTPDAGITAALKTLNDELTATLNVVVAHAPFDLDGTREHVRTESTNLGRLICESLIRATGADLGFLNGGSIRDSIPKGDVTHGQVLSVLPYGNYICVVKMKGSDLLAALNFGLLQPNAGRFPQFYGMTVNAAEREGKMPDGSPYIYYEAETVTVGGKLLDEDAVYSVATNDFLTAGGDGFTMFSKYARSEFGTLEEALLNCLATAGDAVLQAVNDTNVLTVRKMTH
jgi:2',3'-cyclic-nucleotide 2'-phosphodiesterase (5'-nucleotidase family)